MSRAICEKFLGKDGGKVVAIGYDYGDPTPPLPAEGDIYMVDVCIDDIAGDVLLRERLVWIDHHKTSIAKWSHLDIRGLRIDGVAACRLCWYWFTHATESMQQLGLDPGGGDWSQRQEGEPLAVFLIGIRDVWKHTGTANEDDCNHLNLGLASCNAYTYELLLMDKGETSPGEYQDSDEILTMLLKQGYAVSQYLDVTSRQRAERGAMIRFWKGLKFLILNTQAKGSMALDAYARDKVNGWSIDALMVWAVDKHGRVPVSLYHAPGKTHIDLSVIAKEFGGGGHAGACGFIIESLAIIQVIIDPDIIDP